MKATAAQKKIAAQALKLVMNQINGVKGNQKPKAIKIGYLGEMKALNIPVVPSGSLALDNAMGVGGYPNGRMIEVFGPESCIAGESHLQYEVWHQGKRINHKGGAIKRLYERFNKDTSSGIKQGRHLQNNTGIFYIKSVDTDGRVLRNEVLGVVKTGKKMCYKVETETGEALVSTAEHKYMTYTGFRPLGDLKADDYIFVHNNTRVQGRKSHASRPTNCVKYHPNLPTKIVRDKKTGRDYAYFRGQTSRLAYEAFLNDMSFDAYIGLLNTGTKETIDSLTFLPDHIHVHHEDENFKNNDINNLRLVDPTEHGRIHIRDRIRNLSFVIVPSRIISITEVGEIDTYDLKCAYPYNNYIADGIVVHNSGKTTLCLHALAEFQRAGHEVAFIDVEHTLDIAYAKALGVDVDQLIFSQPDDGDEAMRIVDTLTRSGQIGLIIVDSIASLITAAEMAGEITDEHMGRQARLMSKSLKKLTVLTGKTNTTIIFTNQIRYKIGVMYGNPETTCVSPDTLVEFVIKK